MTRFMLAVVVLASIAAQPPAEDWRDQLTKELPALGHRNWIVIADAAYPAQCRPGIKTIVTDANHADVVRQVLRAIHLSKHVRPVVSIDSELNHVPEEFARGITNHRQELARILDGLDLNDPKPVPHDEMIKSLDKAAESFRVVIFKTKMTLPYTSVFIELDCGYWSAEAEQKLRAAMKASK